MYALGQKNSHFSELLRDFCKSDVFFEKNNVISLFLLKFKLAKINPIKVVLYVSIRILTWNKEEIREKKSIAI